MSTSSEGQGGIPQTQPHDPSNIRYFINTAAVHPEGGFVHARPASLVECEMGDVHYAPQSGMTLLDYFAGLAMQAYASIYVQDDGQVYRRDELVKVSWDLAEEMLTEKRRRIAAQPL
jgi:hypothetical protein